MNDYTKEIYDLKKDYYQELKVEFEKKISKHEAGKGCYIATMVYGDYNDYNVLILRYYRDNILQKNIFGKKMIKLYYIVSPLLIKILKNNHFVTRIIKNHLDKMTRRIKEKY